MSLQQLLADLQLTQYLEDFIGYGVDRIEDLIELDDNDWQNLGVKPLHHKRIVAAAKGTPGTPTLGRLPLLRSSARELVSPTSVILKGIEELSTLHSKGDLPTLHSTGEPLTLNDVIHTDTLNNFYTSIKNIVTGSKNEEDRFKTVGPSYLKLVEELQNLLQEGNLEKLEGVLLDLKRFTTEMDMLKSNVERSKFMARTKKVEIGKQQHHILPGQSISYTDLGFGDPPEELGRGATAVVYKASYLGNFDVAVKAFNGSIESKEKDVFTSEISILSKLHHPNILKVIGYCAEPLCIITELMEQGSLYTLLHNTHAYLSPLTKIQMIRGITNGMMFIHGRKIAHRDIKSHNILVNSNNEVKITDFGISHQTQSTMATFTQDGKGTPQWMSPEILDYKSKHVNYFKADVYSFAILMWEVFSEQVPYHEKEWNQFQMINAIMEGVRPPTQALKDCPRKIVELMEKCWSTDPSARPNFTDIYPIVRSDLEWSVSPWRIPESLSSSFGSMRGTKGTSYKVFTIKDDEKVLLPLEYIKVQQLVSEHFKGAAFLKHLRKVECLYQNNLIQKFESYKEAYEKRLSTENKLFKNDSWKSSHPVDKRTKIMEKFNELVALNDWNKGNSAPFVPMLQGTTLAASNEIAQTGFAAVSTLDDGFYGRGIYWTSHLRYALSYCNRGDPQLVVFVAFTLPGNVYPVAESWDTWEAPDTQEWVHNNSRTIVPESPTGTKYKNIGLMGKTCQKGYQSHYVNVYGFGSKRHGYASGDDNFKGFIFDELVTFDEGQSVPKYILYFDPAVFGSLRVDDPLLTPASPTLPKAMPTSQSVPSISPLPSPIPHSLSYKSQPPLSPSPEPPPVKSNSEKLRKTNKIQNIFSWKKDKEKKKKKGGEEDPESPKDKDKSPKKKKKGGDEHLNVVIFGVGHGKTALMNRILQQFSPAEQDSKRILVPISKGTLEVELIIDSGTELFTSLKEQFIQSGSVFIIIYDINSRSSLADVNRYYNEITRIKDKPPHITICGHINLENGEVDQSTREVSYTEGCILAKKLNAQFMEFDSKGDVKFILENSILYALSLPIPCHLVQSTENQVLIKGMKDSDNKDISISTDVDTITCSFGTLSQIPDKFTTPNIKTLQLVGQSISEPNFKPLHNLSYLGISLNDVPVLPNSILDLKVLTELSLISNAHESIPEQIGNLSLLETLNLSNNKLKSLPASIGKLSRLAVLDVAKNQLVSLPNSIGDLSKLKTLLAFKNNLQALPESIGKLGLLETLDVKYNSIVKAPAFHTLGQLKRLDLSFNNLDFINSFPSSLEWINIKSNKLSILPEMGELKNLKYLQFDQNKVVSLPSSLSLLTKLNTIIFTQNHIQILPNGFGKLLISEINLHQNRVIQFPMREENFHNLSTLILTSNSLRMITEHIQNFVNLTKLDLSGNEITELPPQISLLQKLNSLFISKNQLGKLPKLPASLIELDVSFNKLGDFEGVSQLTKLVKMNVSNNVFEDLPGFEFLTNLKELNASSNSFKHIPKSLSKANIQHLNLLNETKFGLTKDTLNFSALVTLECMIEKLILESAKISAKSKFNTSDIQAISHSFK